MTQRRHLVTALQKMEKSYPAFSLQSYSEIPGSKGTVFRITASHANKQPYSANDYINMTNAEFGDNLALIPGSLELVNASDRMCVVSALMVSNTVSKPYDPSQKLSVLASNVFIDDDSGIWKLVGEGDNRRLVQAISEDLSKILAARLSNSPNVVLANANYTGIVPERGDYAIYYSLATMDYRYGYAVPIENNQIMIAPRDGHTEEVISSLSMIDCVDRSSLNEDKQDKKVIAAMMGGNVNRITTNNMTPDLARVYLDYMRNLYADTPYFDTLEKLISIRRATAELGKPISTQVDQ